MQRSEELWEPSYEEMMSSIPDLFFDDVATDNRSAASPKQCNGNGPKGGVGKAVRRRSRSRSRSSKKAPTTLLTADANNFRALVQQFTGCHSATPLLRAYRGPINLNFKHCTYYPQQQQQQQQQKTNNLKVHQESSNHAFSSTSTNKINVGDQDEEAAELFVPRLMGQSPSADPLTFDDNFWGEIMSAGALVLDHQF